MKTFATLILLVVIQQSVVCQTFVKIATLPSACHESSGLEIIDKNLFVTHNDGGNSPVLYFIDSLGTIQREVFIRDAVNVDWEDISIAPDGRVFIGNFGNNGHNRKDLEVLILPDYKTWQTDTVTATRIGFKYGDQNNFPPNANNYVFDCEALAYFEDSLYLFSKNWSNPFSGQVKMYVMPATEGDYEILARDSVNLGTIKEIAWVTGADMSDSSLFLVGSAFVWKFNFTNQPTLKEPQQISLNHFSQKEAISVQDDMIYITDESAGTGGNLYRYSPETFGNVNAQYVRSNVYVQQLVNGVEIRNPERQNISVTIYTMGGLKVAKTNQSNNSTVTLNSFVSNDILIPGVYVLHINTPAGLSQWCKVSITQ